MPDQHPEFGRQNFRVAPAATRHGEWWKAFNIARPLTPDDARAAASLAVIPGLFATAAATVGAFLIASAPLPATHIADASRAIALGWSSLFVVGFGFLTAQIYLRQPVWAISLIAIAAFFDVIPMSAPDGAGYQITGGTPARLLMLTLALAALRGSIVNARARRD